jgi:hypothetical protein
VDADDQPVSVQGVLGFTLRPDFSLDRFLSGLVQNVGSKLMPAR